MPTVGEPSAAFARARVLAACTVGLASGYSVFVAVTFGLFLAPLSEEFGWTRAQVSVAFTVCTYTIVLLAPVLGTLIDRHGVRRLLIPSIGAFGIAVGALSLLDEQLWKLYALHAAIAVAGAATLPTSYSRVVVAWFTTHRGLALSVALSGLGLSTIVLPPLLERVIHLFGWRIGYLALSAACLAVAWPIIAMWLREPARSNGDSMTTVRITSDEASLARAISVIRAALAPLRTRAMLQMALAALLLGVAVGGVLGHLMALLTDALGSTQQAAYAFSALGGATLVSRLFCGWLLDQVRATWVAMAVFALAAAGLFGLGLSSNTATIYFALVLLGIGFGADFDIISYLVSRYVPFASFSRAYGLIYSTFLIGLGAGPVIAGLAYDRVGSYDGPMSILAACLVGSSLLFGLLGPYREALSSPVTTPSRPGKSQCTS